MRIKFFNHLMLCAVGVGLLFTSCKKDDSSDLETINVSSSTWVYNSDADVTAGVTLKLFNNTYEYSTVNYDGATETSRGTFANIPPYEVVLTQEDGVQFGRGLMKGSQIEMEIYMQNGTNPQFQDHAYITIPSTSNAIKRITLTAGGVGSYVAVPSTLDIAVTNDTLDGYSSANDFVDVTLTWSSVNGATQYKIYRVATVDTYENGFFGMFRTDDGSDDPTGTGGYDADQEYAIAADTATSIVLPLQSANVEYHYFVAAYDDGMPLGSPAFAYKLKQSVGIAPVGAEYLVVGADIQLKWDRVNPGANHMKNAAYKIYQVRPDGNRIEIGMVPAEVTTDFNNKQTYTVAQDQITSAEFVSGEEYRFDVTAITASGVESNATRITTTFYDKVANVTEYRDKDGKKMLTWDKVQGAPNYRIYSFPTTTVDMDTTLIGGGIADNKVGVDGYGSGLNPTMNFSMSYNIAVSASANGEYSDITTIAYYPKTSNVSRTTNIAGDTATISWDEVADQSFDADSYTISYSVETDGEYDYNSATGAVTVSMSDVDSNDLLEYNPGATGTFDYEYRIPGSLSGDNIQFYIVVNGNGTQSDAIKVGAAIAVP